MNKRKQFKIGNYVISEKNPPFIIAEVGQAHKGSIKKVFKFIDELASTGINAIKFQTHYADPESTLDEKFRVQIKNFKTRYDYWKSVEFSKDEWLKIKKYSNKKKLIFLSSVFSLKGFNILFFTLTDPFLEFIINAISFIFFIFSIFINLIF